MALCRRSREILGPVPGIPRSTDRAAAYLAPSLKQDLPDPSSCADMDAAAARLADAVHVLGEKRDPFGPGEARHGRALGGIVTATRLARCGSVPGTVAIMPLLRPANRRGLRL